MPNDRKRWHWLEPRTTRLLASLFAALGVQGGGVAAQVPPLTSFAPTPTCATCRVRITEYGKLSARGALGDGDGFADLTALNDSEIVALPFRLRGTGGWWLVTPQGRIRGAYSREGEGPGEFRRPWEVAGVIGDSIFIYDRTLARVSVFLEAGRFVRSYRTPAGASSVRHLPTGADLVVGRFAASSDRSVEEALPFHIVRGDSVLRSFGPVIRRLDPRNPFQYERLVLSSGREIVALSHANEYEVQLYSYVGDPVARIVRQVEWFPRSDRFVVGSREEPPSPIINDAWVDSARRLWVLVSRANPRWKEAFADKPAPAEGGANYYPVVRPDLYYEGMVEVFDLDTRELLTSQRLPFEAKYALGRGIVSALDPDEDDGVSSILYRLALER